MLRLLRGGGCLKIDCIIHIWAASIDPNNNYESTVSKSINEGMPSCNNFPLSLNNLCSCPSQFETDAKAWAAYIRKSSGRHRCVFTQSVIPVVGAFLSEGRVWAFFVHTSIGRRPESVANRQFIPPPPPINIQCSKCVWTQRLQDGIFSRGPIGKGHHEVMEKHCHH